MRQLLSMCLAVLTATGPVIVPGPAYAASVGKPSTRIQHLVVIFQENVSFDHYFGTYPVALNPKGEPQFHAAANTPTVNGLSPALLSINPNLTPANAAGAANPFRYDRAQQLTQDQDHDYTAEQMAFDHGLMDLFPANTGTAGPPPNPPPSAVTTTGQVMGYYDGNSVTALWNYAQFFAMSDNSYDTNFGPSTDGALNLVSGQTNGVVKSVNATGSVIDAGDGTTTLISDIDPLGDVCSSNSQLQMGGKNIGDLLNAAGVTWGFFEGGFNLGLVNANGTLDVVGPVRESGDFLERLFPLNSAHRRRSPPRSLSLTHVRLFFPEVLLEQLAGSLEALHGQNHRFRFALGV